MRQIAMELTVLTPAEAIAIGAPVALIASHVIAHLAVAEIRNRRNHRSRTHA